MSLNRKIYKENVINLNNGVLLSFIRNKIIKFIIQCMELKEILSEVTQSQKKIWYVITEISILPYQR